MNITKTVEKGECTGCCACVNVCPEMCITMMADQYGFLIPQIDISKCIDCGKCIRTCPTVKERRIRSKGIGGFLGIGKDKELLLNSASGGIFSSLANQFLQDGGVVYGCEMDKELGEWVARHIKIDSCDELKKLQGSKYVQSYIGKTYSNVRDDLKAGLQVLFSGTPCQCDGLINYLGREYENLYLIDIVCHGVPSISMFNDFMHTYEKSKHVKLRDFKFRDKDIGWGTTAKYVYENGEVHFYPTELCSYYHYFLCGAIYRECCYQCKYANLNRVGSITIGDYWGVEKIHPEFNCNLYVDGCSLVIVNDAKGRALIEKYGKNIKLIPESVDCLRKYNGNLNHPSIKYDTRDIILKKYQENGWIAVEEFFQKSLSVKTKGKLLVNLWVKRIISKRLKIGIKNIIRILKTTLYPISRN